MEVIIRIFQSLIIQDSQLNNMREGYYNLAEVEEITEIYRSFKIINMVLQKFSFEKLIFKQFFNKSFY